MTPLKISIKKFQGGKAACGRFQQLLMDKIPLLKSVTLSRTARIWGNSPQVMEAIKANQAALRSDKDLLDSIGALLTEGSHTINVIENRTGSRDYIIVSEGHKLGLKVESTPEEVTPLLEFMPPGVTSIYWGKKIH